MLGPLLEESEETHECRDAEVAVLREADVVDAELKVDDIAGDLRRILPLDTSAATAGINAPLPGLLSIHREGRLKDNFVIMDLDAFQCLAGK